MALIPRRNRNPFANFFGDDFFTPARQTLRGTDLAMDVYRDNGDVVAEMNLPGIDPEDVNINLNRNRLTVSGRYERTKGEEDEDKEYTYRERRSGSFSRSVRLPSAVEEDEANATYENGVLTIRMPTREQVESAGTEVQIESA